MKQGIGILFLFLCVGIVGCGEGSQTGTRITTNRMTGSASIESDSEGTWRVGRFGHNKTGTTTQPAGWFLEDMQITHQPSITNPTIPLITAGNTAYRANEYQGLIGLTDAVGRNYVQPVADFGKNYLQMRAQFNTNATQLGMTKHQVAAGLIQGVVTGQVDYGQIAFHAEPEVKKIVDARLDEMQADIEGQRKAAAESANESKVNTEALKAITDQLKEIQKRLD